MGANINVCRYDSEFEKSYLKKMRLKVGITRMFSKLLYCGGEQLGLLKEEEDDCDLMESLLETMTVTGQYIATQYSYVCVVMS